MSDFKAKLVHNEKAKLAANALNTIGAAVFVSGVVGAIIASAYELTAPHGRYWIAYLFLTMMVSGGFHRAARRQLERLIP